ncbi:hypothetical protein LO771_15400 [Streptacidiphilus sp. ASG 303]|uniref:hypothetical protein n=1 Tax=Streptacidiphilus sp. ASG 303 TaxID=2896847 RepID=UPI001E2D4DAF|nr:hypothetical protein [Streptacidiphilus sp. ASG 303]MCD0483743.1 hypothetical protein [Streptacidiphilus sp. ASG 303]
MEDAESDREGGPHGAPAPGPAAPSGPGLPPGPALPHGPALWTGSARNPHQWLLAAVGAACLALGVLVAVTVPDTDGPAAWVMTVAGCLAVGVMLLAGTLAFVHVDVRIDRDALEVRCGHVGLPRRRIPLDQVVDATYQPCAPMHWGGWGYRYRQSHGAAVVVRKGPALVLELGGGRRFTVTVDHPEDAVRVIRDHLPPRPRAA